MQIVPLTVYMSARWLTRVPSDRGLSRSDVLAEDITACLLALFPSTDLRAFVDRASWGFPAFHYDGEMPPRVEDFRGTARITATLPADCDLVGLEERLRPHLSDRHLYISERETIVGSLTRSRSGCVLKAGDAWLHSPEQAEALTGQRLPVRPWFGPAEA